MSCLSNLSTLNSTEHILDADTLINFINTGTLHLLLNLPNQFIIMKKTHEAEIAYENGSVYSNFVSDNSVTVKEVSGTQQIIEYRNLLNDKGLGMGESASIARAHLVDGVFTSEDGEAKEYARNDYDIPCSKTIDLLLRLISQNTLDVSTAEQIIQDIEDQANHRLTYGGSTFRECCERHNVI